jgi:gliding motility-associated-like protein
VNIYNRYGKAVFWSTGYTTWFDGTFNGKPLPAGVYYYVIDVKANERVSGYLTIIR